MQNAVEFITKFSFDFIASSQVVVESFYCSAIEPLFLLNVLSLRRSFNGKVQEANGEWKKRVLKQTIDRRVKIFYQSLIYCIWTKYTESG